MGSMSALSAAIQTNDLCGSCRFYTGDPITGNLTGFCPIDGPGALAKNIPCAGYEKNQRRNNAN